MSAAEQNDEVEVGATDPDPQRLIEKVMDRLDLVLVKQGFVFREEMDWTNAGEEVMAWIFKYYDDLTGGDEDYNPGDSALTGEGDADADDEESDSATLGESDDSDADDDSDGKPSKRTKVNKE